MPRGDTFRQLFVNGCRRRRARIPAEGESFKLTGALNPDKPLGENYEEPRSEPNENHKGFRFAPGQIRRWENLSDVEVVVTHPFATTRMRIVELDESEGIVRFGGPEHIWSYAPPETFYMENVREGLAKSGSWHLDSAAGVVRYRPLPGEEMQSAVETGCRVGIRLLRRGCRNRETMKPRSVTAG